MQIIYIDLETTPIRGLAWGTYDTNMVSIEQDSGLLSVAYKINDEPTQVVSRRLYTERQLALKLWKLFNDADVVVAQNGDQFDMKVANKFFIKYGFKPPAPYKTVDTLKLARRYFKFASNRLDYLSQFLFGEHKIETNIGLWLKCMDGDERALIKMERYNKHDVDLLYRVYHKLRMWHTGHPNSNVYNGTTHQCPTCGHDSIRRGFNLSRVGKFQRYQCKSVKCGAWWSGDRIKSNRTIR